MTEMEGKKGKKPSGPRVEYPVGGRTVERG